MALVIICAFCCKIAKLNVSIMKIQVKQLVDKALESLTDQQRRVLELRFGLDGKKKRTLQEIADEYSLTRERIRQVQNIAITKLREDKCIRLLSIAFAHLEEMLRSCGGAASADTLCATCEFTTKVEQSHVHLLLTVGDSFYASIATDDIDHYWYIDEKHKNAVDTALDHIHKYIEAKDSELLTEDELQNAFDSVSMDKKEYLPNYIDTVNLSRKIKKNPLGEWGLATHPEIALSGLAGYIRVVLREAGEPLHFNEIAGRVSRIKGEECHRGSCHNELVRRGEFILVGRGLYALESMGYRPGTIADIIVAGMKEQGPMTQKEVIEYVSKERHVKAQSIVLTLGKKGLFTKDERSRYFLTV